MNGIKCQDTSTKNALQFKTNMNQVKAIHYTRPNVFGFRHGILEDMFRSLQGHSLFACCRPAQIAFLLSWTTICCLSPRHFFFLFYIYLLFPFCISFLHFLSFYLSLQSCFLLFIFCSRKLSLPSPSIFFSFFFFLQQNLVFTALSCQLQMKSRLCLVLALSYLTCYYASFDSLSSCPGIRLAEERPNTATLLRTIIQRLWNSSRMPQSHILRLSPSVV